MGNLTSNPAHQPLTSNFIRTEWSNICNRGYFELMKNQKSGEICESYKLDQNPNKKDLQIYRFRTDNENNSYFVSIKYLDLEKKQTLCTPGHSYVLTEFIPVTLSSMNNLTINQGYSLLRTAYAAFNTMQAFHSPIKPDEQMIGVNLNGRPKIWLNSNHAKSTASQSKQNIKKIVPQKQSVTYIFQILLMVESKLTTHQFPTKFKQFFTQTKPTFFKAYQHVQEYCQNENIQISNKIDYFRFIQDEQIKTIVKQYINKQINQRQNNQHVEILNKTPKLLLNEAPKILKRNQSVPIAINSRSLLQKNNSQKIIFSHNIKGDQSLNNGGHRNHIMSQPILIRQGIPQIATVIQKPQFSTITQTPQVQAISQKGPQIFQHRHQKSILIKQIPPISSKSTIKIVESRSIIPHYSNVQPPTPQHVTNNVRFVSPGKITQFAQPIRQNLTNNTIRNNFIQHQGLGRSPITKVQVLDHKERKFSEVKSIHQVLLKDIQEPQNQQFNRYINHQNQHQKSVQPSEEVSEPDWNSIQKENFQSVYSPPNDYYHSYHEAKQVTQQNDQSHNNHQNSAYEHQVHSGHEQYQVDDFQDMHVGNRSNQDEQNHQQLLVKFQKPQHQFEVNSSQENQYQQSDQNYQYHYNQPINLNKSHIQSQEEVQQENQQAIQSSGTLVVHDSQQNIYDNRNQNIHITNHQNEDNPNTDKVQQISNGNDYQGLHFRHQSDQLYQYTPVQSIYRQTYKPFSRPSQVEQIVSLQRHEDIQQYIKNKYSSLINGPNYQSSPSIPSRVNIQRMMTFAKVVDIQKIDQEESLTFKGSSFNPTPKNQDNILINEDCLNKFKYIQSKYQQVDGPIPSFNSYSSPKQSSNHDNQADFLDVKNLQKNLDQKYRNSIQLNKQNTIQRQNQTCQKQSIKASQAMSDEDGFNIAALDEKLQKFQQSRQLSKSQVNAQASNTNELQNFQDLDNIVQLMDKKIQQSQSKQKSLAQSNEINITLTQKISSIPKLTTDRFSNISNSNYSKNPNLPQKFGLQSEEYVVKQDFKYANFDKKDENNNQNSQRKLRSQRRISRALQAKKLAQQFENKNAKYMTAVYPSQSSHAFSKKSIYEESSANQKLLSLRVIQKSRKRSYLEPIVQLNGQISPYKAPFKPVQLVQNQFSQNRIDKGLSSRTSNMGSNQSIGTKKSSKLSYQQLSYMLKN